MLPVYASSSSAISGAPDFICFHTPRATDKKPRTMKKRAIGLVKKIAGDPCEISRDCCKTSPASAQARWQGRAGYRKSELMHHVSHCYRVAIRLCTGQFLPTECSTSSHLVVYDDLLLENSFQVWLLHAGHPV